LTALLPWFALAALTLLRLGVAAATPLSPDEAYYWVWSQALATGYYDHPPMVAYWIRAGVALFGDTALGVRLLAPFSAALGTVFLASAGSDLSGDRRVGLWAAILLNATLGFGLGAVSMTPDTPMFLFWIAAIAALGRLLATGRGSWIAVAGISVGLALASKLSAAFLAGGIGAWFLLVPSQRRWLGTAWPWVGGLLAVGIFTPVVAWNAMHGWVGFLRQGGRLAGFNPANAPSYLVELVGAQVGMLTPLVFLLAVIGMVAATRAAWRDRAPAACLLALLCLPPLAVFVQHTLTDRVQGNWPAIVYPAVILATAMFASGRWLCWRVPAVMLGAGLTALVYVQAAFAVLPIPPRLDPSMKRLAGWPDMAGQMDAAMRDHGAHFVGADDYSVASMLAWQLPGVAVIATQPRWDVFDLPRELPSGPGLLVRSARLAERPDTVSWREQVLIGTISRSRNGVTAEEYRLYRVIPHAGISVARLPGARPGWSPK